MLNLITVKIYTTPDYKRIHSEHSIQPVNAIECKFGCCKKCKDNHDNYCLSDYNCYEENGYAGFNEVV